MKFGYLIFVKVVFLTGCSSSPAMRTALTDMGVSSDSEYGAYGMRLQRSIDVTGLGAEEVVGSITSDVDKWSITEQLARLSPIRKDIPDNLSPRLINGQSFIVERQFNSESELTMAELNQLKDALTNLQTQLALIAENTVKLFILKSSNQLFSQKDTDKNQLTEKLNRLYPEAQFDENTLEENLDKQIQSLENQVKSENNQATEIKNNIKEISQDGGIVVTNWQREAKSDFDANLSEANNLQANTRKLLGGYLILAEPRVVTLYIGHDAVDNSASKESIAFKQHRNYLTHFQLRAKKVVYSELEEKFLQASVRANLKSLIELAVQQNLLEPAQAGALDANIEAAYASANVTSSFGALDASKSCLKIRDFSLASAGTGNPQKIIDEIKAAKDTVKVISMRVVLNDQLKIYHPDSEKPPATGLSKRNVNECTNQGTEE